MDPDRLGLGFRVRVKARVRVRARVRVSDELLDHQFVVPILTQRLVRHHLHLHLHLLERPLRAAPVGVLLLEAVSFRVLALLLRASNDLPLD